MFERLENELAICDRHLRVFEAVSKHEPVGLVTLTNRLPYPRHKVRYSLRVLEAEALVDATPDGVTTTDDASDFCVPTDQHLETVAQRLATLWFEPPQESPSPAHSMATD